MVVHRSVLIIDERKGDGAFFTVRQPLEALVFLFFFSRLVWQTDKKSVGITILDKKLEFAETLVHRSLLVVVKGFVRFTFPGWWCCYLVVGCGCRVARS